MIPTNTLEELKKAELDLQKSQVSLIREIGRGNEKSRLHANTLQAMSSALIDVQALMANHVDNVPIKVEAPKKKAK
tara:strand:- start:1447 stop:1674 length:228 start_codon:yes stop_codon:yes gene_type:complete